MLTNHISLAFILFVGNIGLISALASDKSAVSSRRNFFSSVLTSASVAYATQSAPAFALDMDAFMNTELKSDVKKELTDDERSCRYAAPSQATGEACLRAGMKTEGKAGGVDRFGNIDRGTFVRCKVTYPLIDGQYVKTTICE